MCIVIDTNRIPSIFNPKVSDHREFKPVLKWMRSRKKGMVYGGTKYREELFRLRGYSSVLEEMGRAGLVHEIDDKMVDEVEKQLIGKTSHAKFNDHAIIAIVIVSRCKLLCSSDKKSFPFIKEKSLYPAGYEPPRIYSGFGNRKMLYQRDILEKCGPCCS
jgi:hypothetical protein